MDVKLGMCLVYFRKYFAAIKLGKVASFAMTSFVSLTLCLVRHKGANGGNTPQLLHRRKNE